MKKVTKKVKNKIIDVVDVSVTSQGDVAIGHRGFYPVEEITRTINNPNPTKTQTKAKTKSKPKSKPKKR